MDEKLSQLEELIAQIDELCRAKEWGPEYQLWKNEAERLLGELFTPDEVKLFQQQNTVTFSYIDDDFNQGQYQEELVNRKKILEGLLRRKGQSQPRAPKIEIGAAMDEIWLTKLGELKERLMELVSLAQEDLLKADKLYKTKREVEDALTELGKALPERDQLRIERIVPKWWSPGKPDVFVGDRDVALLHPLLNLIQEFDTQYSAELITPPPKSEKSILAGNPIGGRKYLKSILNQAQTDLVIRDNYIKADILDVITEFLEANPDLHVRILCQEGRHMPAVRVHYALINTEYPNRIEIRVLPVAQGDHPRHVLIDGTTLYTPDHSLDQWGVKSVNIHQHEHTDVEPITNKFEIDWQAAPSI